MIILTLIKKRQTTLEKKSSEENDIVTKNTQYILVITKDSNFERTCESVFEKIKYSSDDI